MDLLKIAARVAESPQASIYVDLDETLIRSMVVGRDDARIEELSASGLESAEIGGGYVSFLRPGARDFLAALADIGSVTICTAATRPYAEDALSAFGLYAFLDGVISVEQLSSVGRPDPSAVLVDNLPTTSGDVQAKLRTIGAGSSAHVQVSEFDGDPRDSGLAAALAAVRGLLSGSVAA